MGKCIPHLDASGPDLKWMTNQPDNQACEAAQAQTDDIVSYSRPRRAHELIKHRDLELCQPAIRLWRQSSSLQQPSWLGKPPFICATQGAQRLINAKALPLSPPPRFVISITDRRTPCKGLPVVSHSHDQLKRLMGPVLQPRTPADVVLSAVAVSTRILKCCSPCQSHPLCDSKSETANSIRP
ncbi:uncharacterized protein B0I36DRAFT_66269 [Microdochium trichocladiopsis]|uniref:Uncharacterized protein n=1 Tax=Microdochium trichocladiopsis TaxID=1682393 RepID=A0A9P8YG51_9PEZI|nr:uncharacterized protein B0I36DRAFT_66269 [Microdochium trichocladiopsis]KAH7037440.1 hypothetical protein B0I36DRAFT_66269 [Microdochium trichocladiopsis]